MKTINFIPLVILAFILFVVLILLVKRKSRYPYRAKHMLTKREYKFYIYLKRAADSSHCLICPKVGLKDLMEVSVSHDYMKYFRLISQKHVDFVICDKELNILFAIELDDSSHDTESARRRDKFKNNAFKAAGIPLKRIRDFDERAVWELFR